MAACLVAVLGTGMMKLTESAKLKALTRKARHIRDMLADLYDALEAGRPWSLVRLGDGELHVLNGIHAPWAYYENRCATPGDAQALQVRTAAAIRNADWVGWLQDPGLTAAMDELGFLPEVYGRSQFGWCNLHMGIRRGFVERVLRSERLFLIGGPMQRWLDEVLRPAGLGADATVWLGAKTIESFATVAAIGKAIEASSASVVLASMGVWALTIADLAKRSGKVGIDWGHTPDHNLKPACEKHKQRWGPPMTTVEGWGANVCPRVPECQAHWRYKLNTCCEDSPEGTMEHYVHAGCAGQCLPEKG